MIFRLMLFGFGLAMKTGFIIASLKDSAFKSRIQDRNFLMQVTMKNDNKGRYYQLENGKIKTKGGISPDAPGFLIEWTDSSTALKTLFKLTPKTLFDSITKAVTSGKLAVEIEWAQTAQFLEALVDMAQVYSGFLPMVKKVPGMKKIMG